MLYAVYSKPVPLTQPNVIAYECEVVESSGYYKEETPWQCADVSVQINDQGGCDLSLKIKKCNDVVAMQEQVIAHCKMRAAFVFGSIKEGQDS